MTKAQRFWMWIVIWFAVGAVALAAWDAWADSPTAYEVGDMIMDWECEDHGGPASYRVKWLFIDEDMFQVIGKCRDYTAVIHHFVCGGCTLQ